MGMNLNEPGSGGSYRPMAEINVTPLVDVMLVLLIIFMVTMPMLVTGMKVNLPDARTAKPLEPKDPITVTISRDGLVLLGQEEISRDQLVPMLKVQLGNDADRIVRLRGDKETEFGRIVSVLDELSANGITRVAIVTDTRNAKARTDDVPGVSPDPINSPNRAQ